MIQKTADPLLFAARALILVLLFLTVSAALVFLISMPLAAIRPELALAMLVGHHVGDLPAGVLPLMLGILGIGLLIMLGAIYFLKQLLDIVGTVAAADPFAPANADRLTRMAWTVLGVQIILPAVLRNLEIKLQQLPSLEEAILVLPGTDKSLTASGDPGIVLILVLVLFVLARVFRKGAEMHADLEGTV